MQTITQEPKTAEQTNSKVTIPGQAEFVQNKEWVSVLQLQRIIGNQALQQLIQRLTLPNQPESSKAPIQQLSKEPANLATAHPQISPVSTPAIFKKDKPDTAKQPVKKEAEEEPETVDTQAGTMVSMIIIDQRLQRVGFVVPAPKGMILGSVSTDLKPGRYTATLDAPKKKWVFEGGQVKVGLRFSVSLEGADPWTLAYPDKIPIYVGTSTDRKGGGPMGNTPEDAAADLLRIFDEAPGDIPDDNTIDGYVDFEYVPKWEVKGNTGAYGMQVTLKYINGATAVLDLSSVSDATVSDEEKKKAFTEGKVNVIGRLEPKTLNRSTVPNLWDLKQTILKLQKRLVEMGNAELLDFTIEYGFPAVFTVITINPFVAPVTPGRNGGGQRRPARVTPGTGVKEGQPGPAGGSGKPGGPRVLVVGAETDAEFAYARQLKEMGQQVDVVNPRETAAATAYKAEGGNFINGTVENLPKDATYNLIREDYPYPSGSSITTIDTVNERISRLMPGGRWVVATEAGEEFLPTLQAQAKLRGARVTTYSVPHAHEGAPQSSYPKNKERFVVIVEKL